LEGTIKFLSMQSAKTNMYICLSCYLEYYKFFDMDFCARNC